MPVYPIKTAQFGGLAGKTNNGSKKFLESILVLIIL